MKIVILDGSHNKEGFTLKLIRNFIDGAKMVDKNVEIEQHDLLNENIKFCLGCGKCTEDKNPVMAKCRINNDCAETIKKAALEADVVVWATPIYEFCVSSAMKRFLERCLPLVTFKMGITARAPAIKGKKGVVMCVSGALWPFNHLMGITRYPKFILGLGCKLFRCESADFLFAGGMAINKKMEDKWLLKAKNLGMEIFS